MVVFYYLWAVFFFNADVFEFHQSEIGKKYTKVARNNVRIYTKIIVHVCFGMYFAFPDLRRQTT